MKTLSLFAGLLCLAATIQPAQAQSGTNVAVVDIGFLFDNHPQFKRSIDQMQADVDNFQRQLVAQQQEVENLSERIAEYRPGTTEYDQTEREIARRLADIQVQAESKRREFRAREAGIYHATYEELMGIISEYSTQRQIGLVLRFNSDQLDPEDHDSVMRGVNRTVVYIDRLNITYDIVGIIAQRYGTASQPTAPRQ